MLETTARSVLCQRKTNFSRQYCTADYIQDLTKSKRKTRRDSEALTKQQTILRRTEWIDQKCHAWRIKMWAATIDFMKAFDCITHKSIWDALKSFGVEHDYIHFLKKFYRDQKATVLTDEESDMFEIKKGTKHCDPLSSSLFNTVLQKALEEYIPRRQKKRWMGICLSDNDHDCLTNMRFADDVLLFASSKEQLKKCHANSSEVQKKWDSESRKDENSEQPKLEHQKINWDWWHKVEILTGEERKTVWARW